MGGTDHEEDAFVRAMERNPHMKEYVDAFIEKGKGRPNFFTALSRDMKEWETFNLIYPVGDPIFVHIYRGEGDTEPKYFAIQPKFDKRLRDKYLQVFNKMLQIIPFQIEPSDPREFKLMLDQMLGEILLISDEGNEKVSPLEKIKGAFIKTDNTNKIKVSPREYDELRYKAMKDMAGLGLLEPFIRDPYIEDIHCIGIGPMFIIHKIFELLETNIGEYYDRDLDAYAYVLSERLDKPVSKSSPIADGALPDGSRINIIYGRDVSKRGTSFTIRKFTSTPLSITQLVFWKSMSPQLAAYIWLLLENGMSMFVCGETASGKTTLLNGVAAFIKPDAKILSAEDTPEVNVPHGNWQQLVTRGGLSKNTKSTMASVEMFDLLKAALRSRPDYIIVGEIRGKEGAIAFQAMQAGHPCMATFHASSIVKFIQRFTGDPINVPQTTMDNLNVCVFQMAVYREGKLIRRVLDVVEIEGYSVESQGIITRGMFEWIPKTDVHVFTGMYNSYVLEEKIARSLGMADPKEIYKELAIRTQILKTMIALEMFDYHEVYETIKSYREYGLEGLPFKLEMEKEA